MNERHCHTGAVAREAVVDVERNEQQAKEVCDQQVDLHANDARVCCCCCSQLSLDDRTSNIDALTLSIVGGTVMMSWPIFGSVRFLNMSSNVGFVGL